MSAGERRVTPSAHTTYDRAASTHLIMNLPPGQRMIIQEGPAPTSDEYEDPRGQSNIRPVCPAWVRQENAQQAQSSQSGSTGTPLSPEAKTGGADRSGSPEQNFTLTGEMRVSAPPPALRCSLPRPPKNDWDGASEGL